MLLLAFLLAGCQQGSEGPLDPVSTPGVVREKGEHGRPVAVVQAGPLAARVSGTWATTNSQSITIAYRNGGPAPATIPIGRIAFRRGTEGRTLTHANDLTDMDVNSTDPARYMPRALVGGSGPAVENVTVAPGETRTLAFEFAAFPPEMPLGPDDRITVDIPTSSKPVRVVFSCKSTSLWPF